MVKSANYGALCYVISFCNALSYIICVLFNDVIGRSGGAASNVWIIDGYLIGKDVEGSDRGLI